MERCVTVMIVGTDQRQIRGLAASQGLKPRICVLGPYGPVQVAAEVERWAPDVVLVQPLGRLGLVASVLGRVREVAPSVPILMTGEGCDMIPVALSAGACGVISSSAPVSAMREALLRAAAGELVLEDEELRTVVTELTMSRVRRATSFLTERERQVLCGFAEGSTSFEIAASLDITAGTVQTHMKNVMAKLGVHSKVEAVRIAFQDRLTAVPA